MKNIVKVLARVVYLSIICTAHSSGVFAGTIAMTESVYTLGDSVGDISLKQEISGSQGLTFFAPHSSERATVQKLLSLMESGYNAHVFWLDNHTRRNVSFVFESKRYTFDPNRMFTPSGARASLTQLSADGYTDDALSIVRNFADDVLQQVFSAASSKRILVTLHNNTQGNYSILSYATNAALARDAQAVYINPEMDSDDFFFVTSNAHFQFLKSRQYNVVLQSESVTDDGSLSVYAGQNGIAYVNVETQASHGAVQKEMLELLVHF